MFGLPTLLLLSLPLLTQAQDDAPMINPGVNPDGSAANPPPDPNKEGPNDPANGPLGLPTGLLTIPGFGTSILQTFTNGNPILNSPATILPTVRSTAGVSILPVPGDITATPTASPGATETSAPVRSTGVAGSSGVPVSGSLSLSESPSARSTSSAGATGSSSEEESSASATGGSAAATSSGAAAVVGLPVQGGLAGVLPALVAVVGAAVLGAVGLL